jgi:hypothetical protein
VVVCSRIINCAVNAPCMFKDYLLEVPTCVVVCIITHNQSANQAINFMNQCPSEAVTQLATSSNPISLKLVLILSSHL